MNRALLFMPGSETGAAFLADCLGHAGFEVRQAASPAEADLALNAGDDPVRLLAVSADAAGDAELLLQRAREAGALCVRVARPASPLAPAGAAFHDSLAEPLTEQAILGLLARHRYLAISGREALGMTTAIERQTLGDPAFAAELVQALVSATVADFERLRAARDDLETIRSAAHRTKASAHFVDCRALHAVAQRLETAAGEGDATLAATLMEIFLPTVERFCELLVTMQAR